MSERKVLNKYYPPDFDPSKIPKLREPKNKTFSIRIMAPFNMRCNVCGEYIYKGKKFNSRKENVDDEDFLGLRIFRFYIRCPKCVAEIAFKTDLKNTDYTLEAGATRLFEAEKLAQQMAEEERKLKEAEELNPMKVLENRTKASHKEMAQIDELEELREINARHAKVDTDVIIEKQQLYEKHLERLQKEEEDRIVESIFGKKEGETVKRLADEDSNEDDGDNGRSSAKKPAMSVRQSATDILTDTPATDQSAKPQEPKKAEPWLKSSKKFADKNSLASLVKKKQPTGNNASATTTASSSFYVNVRSASSRNTTQGNSNGIQSNSSSNVKGEGSNVQEKQTAFATASAPQTKVQNAEKSDKNSSANTSGAKAGLALSLLGGYSDSEDSENSSS